MARTRAVRIVRNISLAVAALVCLLGLGVWLWGRGLKKPKVRVVDIRLQRFGSKHVDLLVELAVENPNSVGMELDRLEYQLWVDGRELGVGKVVPPVRLKAAGTSVVCSTVRVRYVDAEDAVAKAMVKKPQAVYAERVCEQGDFSGLGIGT